VYAVGHREVPALKPDAAFWTDYYEKNDPSEKPDPVFFGEVQELEPGAAIDLGAGDGAATFALAELGWQVTAVDFAENAVLRLEERAKARNAPIETDVADILSYASDAKYDLAYLGYIHVEPDQRPPLLAHAVATLRPGGTLLYNGFTFEGTADGENHTESFRALFAPLGEVLACLLPTGLHIHYAEQRMRPSTFSFDEPGSEYMSVVVRGVR